MSTITYHVGNPGFVRKLINNTGPWINVTPPYVAGFKSPIQRDVETDPNDGNKVFVVGEISHHAYGIWVSSDAGVNWTIPTGSYNPDANKWEVCCIDSSNIVVSGDAGVVCKSTNGGASFSLMTQLPAVSIIANSLPVIPNAYSIHFISSTTGVVGCQNNIFLTTDSGTTWTRLSGGIIQNSFGLSPDIIYGIHISQDLQTIVACGIDAIMRSTDGGTTWNAVYVWQGKAGRHLTWEDDLRLWAFGGNNETVRSTDGGLSWSLIKPVNFQGPERKAGHFYLNDTGYFSGNSTENYTIDGALTEVVSEVVPAGKMIEAVWTHYDPPKCYILTNCCDPSCYFIVSNDLSGYVGQIINLPNLPAAGCPTIKGYANCFSVALGVDCTDVIEIDTTGITAFDTCNLCLPTYYNLTNCSDLADTFNTSSDFSQYVGQVVNLSNCGKSCYLVSSSTSCTIYPTTDNTVTASYPDCNACLNIVPVPKELKKRSVKPGYDTPACTAEAYDNITCEFATALYDEMVKARYGITVCCEYDVNYWDVQKQVLDLQSITDPDPAFVTIPCGCYRITQITGNGIYQYMSCETGLMTVISLIAGQNVTVCAKYVTCTCYDITSYTVEKVSNNCSTNTDCA